MTEADPRTAIIRVLDASGATAGSGFLLTSNGLIATCAHVAAAAGAGPGQAVQVAFLLTGLRSTATVIPEYWREPVREDVALLQLGGDVPADAGPLALRRSAGSAGNRFMTFGFPEALAESGMWGYGLVGDIIADPAGVALLQLTGTTETSRGFSGGPVIDQPSRRVVGMVSSITPADRHGRLVETAFATPTETLRRICPLLQVADVCPYRSLDFFDEEHAPFFFGRGKLVTRLLAALRSQPRFLAVLGPSGSGKSSVVRAGLVAGLRRDALPGSSGWDISVVRPAELGASASALEVFAERARAAAASDGRAVLVIDQFEELFSLDEETVLRLGAELGRLAGAAEPATVVLTMRDDFYGHFAAELPELMNGWVVPNIVNIPATLDVEELAEVIKGPADQVGLGLEQGLVEAIIDEAVAASPPREVRSARSTMLPLLEFALTELWHLQDDGVLRRDTFRELGGVTGGLARWADTAYYALAEDTRPIARRILTLLTRLGDESRGMPDSRQQRFLEDFSGPAPGDQTLQILGRLVTARLLVTRRDEATGRVVVELIHDALLREWRLLREWLHEDREFLSWRQNLEFRLRSWGEAPGKPGSEELDWLRGPDLDQAAQWLQTRADDFDARQRAFIEGSLADRRRRQERERALRERAEQQRREADRQRQIAETRGLIARLRAEAEEASALLTLEPARALASAIATTGTNLAALGGEPLGFVQSSLFAAARAAKERRVFAGHGHVVTSVAFDPQGRWIASGSHDRTVRLWPAVEGGPGSMLGEHEDSVLSVAFSPDGQVVASGGADRAVRLWRRDGTPVADPLVGHQDSVLGIAFSPDGQLIAAGSADGGVYLWSMVDFRLANRLLHGSYVASVAFDMDGRLLATGCGDATVRLWRLNGSSLPVELPGHEDFVTSVAFSPDGRALASGGGDRTIRLWTDLGRGVKPHVPRGRRFGMAPPLARHRGLVTSLAFSPDGTALVSAGEDCAVRLWDLAGTPIHAPLLCGDQAVTSVALSSDGRRIAGGCGSSVYLWDWLPVGLSKPPGATAAPSRNGRAARRWDRGGDQVCPAWLGHDDIVTAVAFTSNGRRVVSGGGDRTLRLWELDGTAGFAIPGAHDGGIPAVACSPRGFEVVASGGRDNLIRLWDLSGNPLGTPFEGHTSDVMAVAFSPDGELLASASRDRTVRLWRLDGTPQGEPFTGHQHSVVAVAFSPDGKQVASAGGDGTVRLWGLDGAPYGDPFVGHQGYVHAVAFSPDGQTLVSCGDDRCVRLWDEHGRQIGRPLRAHTEQVRAVVFHPAGQLVVSTGGDGTIRTWDRAGGPVTRPLEGHAGSVLALAISPDGELMVTGGEDGTVRLWRLGSWQSWLREGCERLAKHPLLADDADEMGRAARDACRNLTFG